MLASVLAGLEYAHSLKDYDGTALNVVHRDVTPANVRLSEDLVRAGLDGLIAETGPDELIAAAAIHDHAARLHSYELLGRLDAGDATDLKGARTPGRPSVREWPPSPP